ncbi:MAG TPA: hypothetical protein DCM59_09480 [Clostridium sp.]|nr:hypothetical protein [Clostridium sp.]
MLIIQDGNFTFSKHHTYGPIQQTKDHGPFNANVKRAYAVLSGTEFGFSPPDDHHLGRVTVNVTAHPIGNIVHVVSNFGVRDWSGDWDDSYEGNVQYTVFIELEDVKPRA